MLPKDKSGTTFSRSATSKTAGPTGVETDIQYVKGVGPRLGAQLSGRGISTVKDLLTFFPRAYEDRSRVTEIDSVENGATVSLVLEALGSRKIPTRTGKSILEVRCTDGKSGILLKWFYAPRGMESRFTAGSRFVATGVVKVYQGRPEMIHPEISQATGASLATSKAVAQKTVPQAASVEATADFGRIVPIYVEIEGIPTRTLRNILWNAVERFAPVIPDDVPTYLAERHGLPAAPQAVREIHFPSEAGKEEIAKLQSFRTPAQLRIIYEEFLKFEYLVLQRKLNMEKLRAPTLGLNGGRQTAEELRAALPFRLTGDQDKALKEIISDFALTHPMNRLVQGDVGSGKTAVAFLAAGLAIAEGGQCALMAPTEILAEQHYKNALKLFGDRIRVAILTGKSTQSERNQLIGRLSAGEPTLLIGTHALIEDPVIFKNLVLVMIDEQHRFGVDQRRKLRDKGLRPTQYGTEYPHSLALTATPIPRTLALSAYGDLSVSTIREMPPGRTPVRTKVVKAEAEREKAYEFVRAEIRSGRQAYFIYPLVNQSEAEGFESLASATQEAERLATQVFPEFKLGLLHGQQKSDEKADVMARFARGEIQILVSTTVVEVGVDVPNATVICIENAERFGLSQLHQLRGRVGRSHHSSQCYLLTHDRTGENSKARLEVLEQTNDGFEIAEADLQIRGPGEFLGVRQSGALPFRMADLVRDGVWLQSARDDALEILRKDPLLEAPENLNLQRYFQREGRRQASRLGAG